MSAEPNWRGVLASPASASSQINVIADKVRTDVMRLPLFWQIDILRAIARGHSEYEVSDRLMDCADDLLAELRFENLRNDEPGIRHEASL